MKWIKEYSKFLKESKLQVEEQSLIIEKQIMHDLSKDFWNLCLKSEVFTIDEKEYISKNLSTIEVKLNEEWEWLDKAVNYAKEKGDKFIKIIKGRIEKLKAGIKNFIKSMVEMAKNLLTSFFSAANKYAQKLSKSSKTKVEQVLEKNKVPEDEWSQLKLTLEHWGLLAKDKVNSAAAAYSSAKNLFINVQSSAEKQSIENLNQINFSEVEEDVLIHFYNFDKINEAEDAQNVQNKEAGSTTVWSWLLKFLGQEKLDPDVKIGKKLFWWGKFFLKVLGFILSPLTKLLESLIKFSGNKILKGISHLTKQMSGPGVFEFVVLGGIVAGLVGIAAEAALLSHLEFPGNQELHQVVSWIAHAVEAAGDLAGWYKIITTTLTTFCLVMTVWHVYEEIKHLKH